ncbi:MAG: phenylacetic acid degradation operon negative regulatory protein PaaX, partial [Aestuariivirgaceae bacterium]
VRGQGQTCRGQSLMGNAGPLSNREVAGLLAELDPRAGPLIITVFGDAIAPRSGNIWLGSLIALMSHFGLSERLVRTGVFRLTKDGWFATRSRGRRSFYELTPDSRKTFADADSRIYSASLPDWDGTWTLVQALPDLPARHRQRLRDALKWYGFGQLSPTLMVSPRIHAPSLFDNVAQDQPPAVFTARLADLDGAADLTGIAAAAWNIDELNAAYVKFTERFEAFTARIPGSDVDCFVLRSLLLHEYRRILLQDPQLPSALAPEGWAGKIARDLSANLYRALTPPADRFIQDEVECWAGACPAPAPDYHRRFERTD